MHIRVQASQRARLVRKRSGGPETKTGQTHRRERRGMGHQARGALFPFTFLPEIWVSSRISVVVPGPYFMGFWSPCCVAFSSLSLWPLMLQ